MTELWSQYSDVWRSFQFDYVYVDAVLLTLWIALLVKLGEHKALLFGAVVAPLLFAIDAGIWWNTPSASGVYIREYWIGGIAVGHPAGELAWAKFACDFMMTISYSLFAFTWFWIAFRAIRTRVYRRALLLLSTWLGLWLLVPVLSVWLSIDDTPVRAVRHMGAAYVWWTLATVTGATVMLWLYRSSLRTPLLVLVSGAVGALVMEVPLHLSGIRPFDLGFIAFEAAVLLNQAVPFLYVLYDKVLASRVDSGG